VLSAYKGSFIPDELHRVAYCVVFAAYRTATHLPCERTLRIIHRPTAGCSLERDRGERNDKANNIPVKMAGIRSKDGIRIFAYANKN